MWGFDDQVFRQTDQSEEKIDVIPFEPERYRVAWISCTNVLVSLVTSTILCNVPVPYLCRLVAMSAAAAAAAAAAELAALVNAAQDLRAVNLAAGTAHDL